MAIAMMKRRPSTSAITPVKGAVNATASALTVMIWLMTAGPTPNSSDINGSTACGAYMLSIAVKPAVAIATRGMERSMGRAEAGVGCSRKIAQPRRLC